MQVDHILARNRKETGDSHVRLYLKELENRGFDLEHPDLIENFFPSCGRCNRAKSNDTRDAVTLREYHAIALNHTPKVLKLTEKRKKLEKAEKRKARKEARRKRKEGKAQTAEKTENTENTETNEA